MKVRAVLTAFAAPGKGDELAQQYEQRCAESAKQEGCEQYEVFRSVSNPERFLLVQLWRDQAALDAHLQISLPPMPEGLRIGGRDWEVYQYNKLPGSPAAAAQAANRPKS